MVADCDYPNCISQLDLIGERDGNGLLVVMCVAGVAAAPPPVTSVATKEATAAKAFVVFELGKQKP